MTAYAEVPLLVPSRISSGGIPQPGLKQAGLGVSKSGLQRPPRAGLALFSKQPSSGKRGTWGTKDGKDRALANPRVSRLPMTGDVSQLWIPVAAVAGPALGKQHGSLADNADPPEALGSSRRSTAME